ncbi:interleukin-22 receptor subunit alpha-1 [Pteronotus mesoamericanus]|uniref:interleukin-22 receptor subunit alpha-1 n=1 Tax=Pteronotus mesoamericanus TaxID=1884717 RepID=UPI0023EDDA93|nr:interleukin-22 receptor subunit alpha-1 [Pteronotus parnellii mesoamericanus]
MRTLLTILAVGSLVAHIAEDASDLLQHVKFQSSNFENILTWDSAPESTPGTVYSVEYKTYGEIEWLAKKGCQQITRKSCNLTMETASLTELYYARVTATSAGGRSATKMTDRFSSLHHTTIKPPDVTCIPKVKSIQMIVHPTCTPLHSADGHRLTLEDVFQDLFYRLDLHINQTYQMHLGGKQREYEFIGLTPDTEFLGTIKIFVPTWSKESAPYVCRVKTLPDRTWTYSFSGAFLFSMGFVVAGLCYLSYRYITKPPQPPDSLNVQPVLTFRPLQFIQEHFLIPASELSSPSSLAQPVQYSRIIVSGPPPGAPPLHSRSEVTYRGQPDVSVLQPPRAPPHQILPPPSYAPQAAPEVRPSCYTAQGTTEDKAPSYAPQTVSSYAPQATSDSWPPSYGVCMEDSGKDSPPVAQASPKHLRPKSQLQKEPPAGSCITDDLSLQRVASLATEEPQEAKSFRPPLHVDVDGAPDTSVLHKREPGTPGYLKSQLPLLSSVQIEGHPVSLPLHTPSLPCSPTDQVSSPWGLLESLVCSKDEDPGSKSQAHSAAPRASDLEQPTELDSLFRGLALTVQWES